MLVIEVILIRADTSRDVHAGGEEPGDQVARGHGQRARAADGQTPPASPDEHGQHERAALQYP